MIDSNSSILILGQLPSTKDFVTRQSSIDALPVGLVLATLRFVDWIWAVVLLVLIAIPIVFVAWLKAPPWGSESSAGSLARDAIDRIRRTK
jgi:hypothetical protein